MSDIVEFYGFFGIGNVGRPLKADRVLSKLNFLFHLKSKNLVTLWKCYSHLKYYKIDLNYSIKLQKIKLYVSEEYKTEREARCLNISERTARRSNISELRAMRMCPQSGQIFTFSSWMRRYWFYVKNDFRNFHQIFTF